MNKDYNSEYLLDQELEEGRELPELGELPEEKTNDE